YRSAAQTSNPAQADGAVNFTVNATDNVAKDRKSVEKGKSTDDRTARVVRSTEIGQQTSAVVDGFVKKNTGYFIYANVSDGSGSGIQSVTANVNNVTTGSTSVAFV